MSSNQAVKLIISGVDSSGLAIIDGVIVQEDPSFATKSSFHRIESFNKFEVVECEVGNTLDVDADHLNVIPPSTDMTESTNVKSCRPSVDTAETVVTKVGDEQEVPLVSSGQFERKRTASLAAAILSAEHAPGHKATIQFVAPFAASSILEACETAEEDEEKVEEPISTEAVISRLTLTLRALQMSDPDRHLSALQRIQDLEQELRAIGYTCPADPEVSDTVAKLLANAPPTADLQIRMNSSKQTTKTRTTYETSMPGMQGLDPNTVQQLHEQLLTKLTSTESSKSTHSESTLPVTEQRQESAAEGYTTGDGSTVVSKKMTRIVTTTKATIPGDMEMRPDLIRLKVNEQVYSGTVDPKDQHIHLVPIQKTK